MNGYTSNPYTDRRYGPYLSATQGFLNSYRQYMREAAMTRRQFVDTQYRQSLLDLRREHLDLSRQREERLSKPEAVDPYKIYGQMQGLVGKGMPPELAMRGLKTKGALTAFTPYGAGALFPPEETEEPSPAQQMTQEWLRQWQNLSPEEKEQAAQRKFLGPPEKGPTSAELINKRFLETAEDWTDEDWQRAAAKRWLPTEKKPSATELFNRRLFEETEDWTKEKWGEAAERKWLGPEDKPFTDRAIQVVLGELESGGAKSIWGLDVMKFGEGEEGRKRAIQHALRHLGPDWPTIAPQAVEIIDRKWPGKTPIKSKPITSKSLFGRRITDKELDNLIEEFDSNEMAIRQAAKERGLIIPEE